MECAKCGSARVIPDVQIVDQGEYSDGQLKARVDSKPQAILFKGAITTRLRGRVCGDCGFVELFVDEPEKLFDAWQHRSGE